MTHEISTYHPIAEFQGNENWSSRIIHPGPDLSLILQDGTGAVARLLHDKIRSVVSPMDFAAVGDGVANDQAQFTLLEAAFPDERIIDLEGRTYLVTTIPTGHHYVNGFFKVGVTLYPAGLILADYLTDDSDALQAIANKLGCITKNGLITTTAQIPFAQGIALAGASTHASGSTNTYASGSTVTYASGSTVNVTATGATTARTLASHLGDLANVKDLGVVMDGVTDDTVAWNAALASGRSLWFPEGDSFISGKLSMSTTRGQRLVGAGNNASQFIIDTTFNLAATCVIEIKAIGQHLESFGMVFEQPSTAVRANLVAYPWAILASTQPSTNIHDIWISNCYKGIRLYGNCGQSVVDYVKVGGFVCDLEVDGSTDTVRIDHFHSWPLDFGGDASLMSIYSDGVRYAARFGRVDDLDIGSFLSFEGRLTFSNLSGLGNPFGVIGRLSLDGSSSNIDISDGKIAVASCYGTGGDLNDFKIGVSGTGGLAIASLYLLIVGSTVPQSFVYVTGATANLIIGSILCELSSDSRIITVESGGTLSVSNGVFVQRDSTARGQAVFHVAGGRANITNCTMKLDGAGTGIFVQVDTDAQHVIANNNFGGFVYTLPAQQALGCYGPNSNVTAPATGAIYQGAIRSKFFAGTLSGAGTGAVTHGVTNGNVRMVSFQGWHIGGAGERIPLTMAYIDGASISLTGGPASANYVAWLQYY